MPGATSPLGFPYPVAADRLDTTLTTTIPQLAEALDDYLSSLAAVAPTAPASLTLNAGFTGSVQYARRAGMVTVWVTIAAASWPAGYDLTTAPLPAGFRPPINTYCQGRFGSDVHGFTISTAGVIEADVAGTDGIFGHVTFAV